MSEIARMMRKNEPNELLEVLTGVSDALTKHTSVMERFFTGTLNGVLESRKYRFGSDGVLRLSWPAVCGSACIINPATTAIVFVAGDSAGTTAPPVGSGIADVPASSWVNVVVGARSLTLFGTANAYVTVQAFTGLQAFGVSW